MTKTNVLKMKKAEILEMAKDMDIEGADKMTKDQLAKAIMEVNNEKEDDNMNDEQNKVETGDDKEYVDFLGGEGDDVKQNEMETGKKQEDKQESNMELGDNSKQKDPKDKAMDEINNAGMQMIDISDLQPSKYNFFKRLSEEKYQELKKSIEFKGILNPLIVRPIYETDEYEILSGHNRKTIAEEIGLKELPCVIMEVDDEVAKEIIVDTNMAQRDPSQMSPMEIAKAYEIKAKEFGRRQGIRSDIDSSEVRGATRALIGKQFKVSGMTVDRYLRLNDLIPAYQIALDEGDLKPKAGFELGLVDEQTQRAFLKQCPIEETSSPIAKKVKKAFVEKNKLSKEEKKALKKQGIEPQVKSLTAEEIKGILNPDESNKPIKVTIEIPADFDEGATKHIVGLAENSPMALLEIIRDYCNGKLVDAEPEKDEEQAG